MPENKILSFSSFIFCFIILAISVSSENKDLDLQTVQIPFGAGYADASKKIAPVINPEIDIDFKSVLMQLGIDDDFRVDPESFKVLTADGKELPSFFRSYPENGLRPASSGKLIFSGMGKNNISGKINFKIWQKGEYKSRESLSNDSISIESGKVSTSFYSLEYDQKGNLSNLRLPNGRLLCREISWSTDILDKSSKYLNSGSGKSMTCSKMQINNENGISKSIFYLFLLKNYSQVQLTYYFYPEYIEVDLKFRPPASHPEFRIDLISEISRSENSAMINSSGFECSVFPSGKKLACPVISRASMDFLSGDKTGVCFFSESDSNEATLFLRPRKHKFIKMNMEYKGSYKMGEKLPAILRAFILPHGKLNRPGSYLRKAQSRWHVKTATPRYKGEAPFDTDRDALSDEKEFSMGTNPFCRDTDGDGIDDKKDKAPLLNNINSLFQKTVDSDGDGIDDITEIEKTMTSPYHKDSDGDGLDDKKDTDPLVAEGTGKTADVKVKKLCGVPALYINGKPLFGNIAFHDLINGFRSNLFKDIARTGMPNFMVNNYQIPMYGSDLESSFNKLDNDIKGVLSGAPASNIILRIRLTLHPDFARQYPGGIFRFADGGSLQHSLYYGDTRPFSFGSKEFTAAYSRVLAKLGNFLRSKEYSDRIIGVSVTAGLTNEWRWWMLNDRSRGGDAGPAMKEFFRDYLIKKYNGDVRAFRAKWRDPFVDFATAKCKNASVVTTGSWIGGTPGKLADPFLSQRYIDYDEARIKCMEKQADMFCGVLKKAFSDNLICGVFYGGGVNYQIPALDSKSVNFHVTPSDYDCRRVGRDHAHYSLLASLRRRNKFLLHEDDIRTHKIKSWMPKETPQNLEDTLKVLKRVFGRHLVCGEMAYWQQFGHNWYNVPQIFDLFRRQYFISSFYSKIPHRPTAQIAVVKGDTQYQSDLALPRLGVWEHIANGAMTENISLDDVLKNPDPYKVIIFACAPSLNEKERRLFRDKVAKGNRIIVFLMCAGAVNPDLADPLSLSNISDLTGMKFSWQGLGDEEYYKGDLELTSQGEKFCLSKKEGDILFDEKLNFYNTYNNALRIVPLAVEESSGMETLARFKSTGKAAWAIKKFDDYSAMYIASSRMPAEALSRLADIAGVHRYGAPGNVLYANESLILYHPGSKGRHKIKLPNKTDIYELYSGEWIGEGKDEIVEYLDLGQTRFYLLGNKENLEPAIKSAEEKFSTRLKEIKQKQQDGIADRLKKKNKGDGPFYAGYGGSIENYLVLSSIPIAKKNGNLKEDAIRMMERKLLPDEASFVPAPGQNMSIDGAQKSWTRIWHDSLFFDCPAMTGSLEGDEIAVFYLFVEVELPEDMKFKIKFWNDDYLVIYFNGEKVLPLASVTSFGARPLVLNGKKGRNRFLIKLANTGGPGGFGMQLRSIDDKGLRGMKYYLSSKSEK